MISKTNAHTGKLKGIYAITDERLITKEYFSEAVESALLGGVSIIQYRDKSENRKKRLQQARTLRTLCTKYNVTCIINDDIELAKAVAADGVHLGKDDNSLTEARDKLGGNVIIGISCYNDIERAITAQQQGADYVAFGAMFSSPTKPEAVIAGPDIIAKAKQQLAIPVCCIGGITVNNVRQLVRQGADMAAVISELYSAKNIQHTAKQFTQHFS